MGRKRITVTLLALTLVAAAALAALGDVVGSFKAPGANTRGLARSSTRLYLLNFGSPSRIYLLAPVTGSVYDSWAIPFGNNCRGLAYAASGHLWVGNYGNDYVYDCRPATGSIYRSWSAGHDPYGLAPYCTGDGGVGTTAILTSDYDPAFYWRHNPANGSILSSHRIRNASFMDIAWDHRNKLVWMGTTGNRIYGYTTTGVVKASFTVPSNFAYGLAYYNEILWIGCDGNNYVYRVECPGTVTVWPASWGRVKALYRD
ncbi:MAG: hypothetical protein JSU81_06635 [Candidatus Coatesbacteria bacterium]|nr:MAG: hypothetical protein JSU81_06635 [Candidatus Coatesbacteria bacterium]